jgi:hypothetical protein
MKNKSGGGGGASSWKEVRIQFLRFFLKERYRPEL